MYILNWPPACILKIFIAIWDDLPMEFKIFVYCGTVEIPTVITCALDIVASKNYKFGYCENIRTESNRPSMQA